MLIHLLKKYWALLLLVLFFAIPNISQAATSDCMQTHSDGTFDCFKATSTWSLGGSNPTYSTFEELQNTTVNLLCSPYPTYTCYEQTELNTPTLPAGKTCVSFPACGIFTQTYDTTANEGGRYVVTYYTSSSPYYSQRNLYVYHFRTCPINTTSVTPGSTSLVLCKPPVPITQDKSCPYGGSDKLSCAQKSRGETVVGDPINVSSGAKTLVETDYIYNSAHPFVFKRYYSHIFNNWKHEYDRVLSYTNTSQGEIITLNRPSFQTVIFKKISGVWTEFNTNYGTNLTQSGNDFIYTNELDEKEYYTNLTAYFNSFTAFNLTTITKPGGAVFTLSYDLNGLLNKITDTYSNQFNIVTSRSISGCNDLDKISSITGPGSKTTSFAYDGSCRLNKVTYPDTKFKEYIYGSYALRQVIDENADVYQLTGYASTTYKGYAGTSEGLGSSGAIDKITLDYNTANQVTLNDANSNSVTVTQNTYNKITAYNTQCTFCIGMQGSSISYDSNGYVSSITDFRSNVTNYTWNSKGLMLTKTENYGGALQRTTTYTYGTNHNFPLTSSYPVQGGNKVSTYTYDSNFNVTNISSVAPKNDGSSTSETRDSSFTYNALGALTNIYGFRYSNVLNDKLTLTYNSTGQVDTVTNGLNQVITFSDFNNYGKPQKITDSSSRVNLLTYDSRGRILTSTFKSSLLATDGETSTLVYDNAGLIAQITSPSGAYKKMYYDTAHRLIKIEEYNEATNYLGKTEFTLDNMSNLTALKVYNSSNTQIRTSTATYDSKNRLYQAIGALNQTDTYTYDNNSNLTQVTNAASNNTTRTYDALNRLSGQTNPDSGVTSLTYHADNNIATVTDPKSLVTTYNYSGFGELIKLDSPDTGVSTITRDASGNALTYLDAKSQSSSMVYDDLNRLTSVSYTGASAENVSLSYDSCTNGTNRICSISDISGSLNYTYNSKGRLATKNYVNSSFSKTVGYSYNSYGQLSNITYPSGKIVNYSYVNNKISGVNYTDGLTTTDIATNVSYEAFNSNLSGFTWGNSATYNQAFNNDGVIISITASNAYPVNKGYTYDSRYNITAINETGNTSRSSTASYNNMSRISNYTYGTSGNTNDYTYNTSEDRITQKLNSGTATTYNYDSSSHKLTSLSGGSTDSMTYDANGNILTASGKTYTYNAANRMATSNDGSITTNYLINFMGQRAKKSNSGATTWFIYDENDNVIAEYDAAGNLTNEYVYLDNRPIALIRSSNLYYIYTDHLNTPRAITDTSNNLQWTWENKEAFGNNLPVEVVTGFKFNLRFPGQYFDSETNLNYNLHRDYNPVWGRYVQSDPLGLAAGINTYAYVGGNSLVSSDKLGLSPRDVEAIKFIFYRSLQEMISKNIRFKGNGNDSFNWNNPFARACNPTIENPGLYPILLPCFQNFEKLEYCDGQSTYLSRELSKVIYTFDDNWKIVTQNNKEHWWLVARSANKKDPDIYLDAWTENISVGKACKLCGNPVKTLEDRPLPRIK